MNLAPPAQARRQIKRRPDAEAIHQAIRPRQLQPVQNAKHLQRNQRPPRMQSKCGPAAWHRNTVSVFAHIQILIDAWGAHRPRNAVKLLCCSISPSRVVSGAPAGNFFSFLSSPFHSRSCLYSSSSFPLIKFHRDQPCPPSGCNRLLRRRAAKTPSSFAGFAPCCSMNSCVNVRRGSGAGSLGGSAGLSCLAIKFLKSCMAVFVFVAGKRFPHNLNRNPNLNPPRLFSLVFLLPPALPHNISIFTIMCVTLHTK